MKKRALSLLVCAAVMTTLCGCGDKNAPVNENSLPGYVQPDNERVNPILEPEPEWEYYESDDGQLVLQSYRGKDKSLTIPGELDGKPVKRLSTFFSIDNDVTTALKIPAALKDIGGIDAGDNLTEFIVEEGNEKYYSADGCLYEKTVYDSFSVVSLIRCPSGKQGGVSVADGTEYISSYAFEGCKYITAVDIPEGVMSVAASFIDCTSLTSIKLPENVRISGYAFKGCTSLETIDIPETADISAHAFDDTPFLQKLMEQDPFVVVNGILIDATTLKGEVTLPDNIETIAFGAFAPYYDSNTWLKKVTFPEGFSIVDYGAFVDCEALEEVVLPDGLEEIDMYAFDNCTALKSIELPDGLTDIGMYAFNGCASLTGVDIPDGVTYIGSGAFQNCENLERVSVPDSLVYVGFGGCFEGCEKLTVTFKGNTYTYAELEKFYEAVEENARAQFEQE